MTDEEWIRLAVEDESLVVDVLLQLSQEIIPGPSNPQQDRFPLGLRWSNRQRRTGRIPTETCNPNTATRSEADKTAHASPKTPLSWSGGFGAASYNTDGLEESSRFKRSKVVAPRKTITRRSTRKKTLPELKEVVNLLLNEKRTLETELATWRTNFEKERAENERLRKLEVKMISSKKSAEEASSGEQFPSLTTVACECRFLLPDLNVLATDDSGGVPSCEAR